MAAPTRTDPAPGNADLVTGRAIALALRPGLEPHAAVAELVVLVGGLCGPLEAGWSRLRALALETTGPTLQLALDLLAEAVARAGQGAGQRADRAGAGGAGAGGALLDPVAALTAAPVAGAAPATAGAWRSPR